MRVSRRVRIPVTVRGRVTVRVGVSLIWLDWVVLGCLIFLG